MNNNIYVRSSKSIFSISLTRMLFIIPMILYGFYKNGIYLYQNNYISLFNMFRPLIIILGSAVIGALINIIYEIIIKKNKDKLINILFSSFTIEYAVLIACVMSINVNLLIYFGILFIVLFISKFLNNRINIMAIIFLVIYVISYFTGGFSFANNYENSKVFSYTLMDYFIGRDSGGIASTHIIFLSLAIFGLFITNNNKTDITLSSIVTFIILSIFISMFNHVDVIKIIFNNNIPFIFSLIATDSVTSCYTGKGMITFGILIGIITALLSVINPIIAPYIAIAIASLFNVLIDKYVNILIKKLKFYIIRI